MQTKPHIQVECKQGTDTADIYLYGYIGESWFEEGNTGKSFLNEIRRLEADYKKVNLHIHSGGGSVFEGWAIMNAIVNSKMKFVGIVDGIAASMAFMILMACDERKMMRNSMLMAHRASGGSYGTSDDMRASAELLDKIDQILFDKIKQVSKLTEEELATMLAGGDHWFTAGEALDKGFVTQVIDSDTANAKNATVGNVQSFFTPKIEAQLRKDKLSGMKKEYLILALGLKCLPTDSDETVQAEIASVFNGMKNALEVAKTERETLQQELTDQLAENESLQQAIVAIGEQKKVDLINDALEKGKITATQVETYKKVGETASLETLENLFNSMTTPKSIVGQLPNPESEEIKPRTMAEKVAARLYK